MSKPETIKIDEVEYVRKDCMPEKAKQVNGMDYVIVRTYSAGVFAGYLERFEGKQSILRRARRIWYWKGAASLSQLAMEGTKNPDDCKFPCEVDKVTLTESVELLEVTEKARKSIQGVKIWKE